MTEEQKAAWRGATIDEMVLGMRRVAAAFEMGIPYPSAWSAALQPALVRRTYPQAGVWPGGC